MSRTLKITTGLSPDPHFSLSPGPDKLFTACMNRSSNVPCTCTECGGQFEFAATQIGLTARCPLCRKETELQLSTPEIAPTVPRRLILWTIVALVILLAGLGISLVLLKKAEGLVQKTGPMKPAVERPAR
jgi:hypothetical protein